jgi:hypothetical protein
MLSVVALLPGRRRVRSARGGGGDDDEGEAESTVDHHRASSPPSTTLHCIALHSFGSGTQADVVHLSPHRLFIFN